jgi:hypothetical protein
MAAGAAAAALVVVLGREGVTVAGKGAVREGVTQAGAHHPPRSGARVQAGAGEASKHASVCLVVALTTAQPASDCAAVIDGLASGVC